MERMKNYVMEKLTDILKTQTGFKLIEISFVTRIKGIGFHKLILLAARS